MPTADCQMSDIEGKILGLHSTVSPDTDNENTRLNHKTHSKKAEKRPQLRKSGYPAHPRRPSPSQAWSVPPRGQHHGSLRSSTILETGFLPLDRGANSVMRRLS